MIGNNLLRYSGKQKFLLFDTESNGLHLGRSLPWQIAYSICTIKGIEATTVRHPLWPKMTMSEDAAQVNRFNKASYLKVAEDPEIVLRDFEALLFDPQYILLGHNILGFDCYIVNTWRKLLGRKEDWSFIPRILDTLCLSRAYRRMMQPDLANLLAWQYKMLDFSDKIKKNKASEEPKTELEKHLADQKGTGCSLGAMAKEFDVEYDERYSHEASYDCRVNYQVFQNLIWKMEV